MVTAVASVSSPDASRPFQISLPDYPFASRWFEQDGLRMHYVDEGPCDAPVVLMLHGNPTWSFFWRKLILSLCDRYRCIAVDHIGMGMSDKPRDDRYGYRLADRVEDVKALADHLQLGREGGETSSDLSLAVHDWGGMIGMTWATAEPDRVSRYLVCNTGGFHLPEGKTFPWQIAFCRAPVVGPMLLRGGNVFCRGAIRQCVVKPMDAAVRAGYLAPYDSWSHRRAVQRFVDDIPMKEDDPSRELVKATDEKLATLADRPALLCWGMKDFVFDHHFLRVWRERWPNAEVHEFADAGHYLFEDASDEILPVMRAFLDKQVVKATGKADDESTAATTDTTGEQAETDRG